MLKGYTLNSLNEHLKVFSCWIVVGFHLIHDSMDDTMKLALMIPTSVDIRNVIGQLNKCAGVFFQSLLYFKGIPFTIAFGAVLTRWTRNINPFILQKRLIRLVRLCAQNTY